MALTSKQIAEFYVVLFNRAAENSGLNYWRNLNLDDIKTINLMLDTQAAKDYFKGTVDDNKAFVELIYKNSLGKTSKEDKAGVDYWTNLLNKGTTRGEIVKGIVAAAKDPANVAKDPVAAKTFANKVEISEYFASKVKNVLKDKDGKFNFSKFQDVLKSTNDKNLADQKKAIDEIASKEPIDNQVDPIVEPKPNPNPGNEGGATPPPPPPQAKADLISDADGFFKLNGIDVKLKEFDKVYFKDNKYYKSAEISPANEITLNSVVAEMKNEKISIVFDTEDANNPTIADAKLGFSASLKKEVSEKTATVNAKSYSDISSILLDANVSKVIKSLTIDEPITDENLTQLVTLGIKNGVVVAKMSATDILAIKDVPATILLLKNGSLTIANPTKDDVATIKAILANSGLAPKIDPKDPALKIDGVLQVAQFTVQEFVAKGASIIGYKDVEIKDPQKANASIDEVEVLVAYKQVLKDKEFDKLALTIVEDTEISRFINLGDNLKIIKEIKINKHNVSVVDLQDLEFVARNKSKITNSDEVKVTNVQQFIQANDFKNMSAGAKELLKENAVTVQASFGEVDQLKSESKIGKFNLKNGTLTDKDFEAVKSIKDKIDGDNPIMSAELNAENAKTALADENFAKKFENNSIVVTGQVTKEQAKAMVGKKNKLADGAIKDLVLDNDDPQNDISSLGVKLADNSVTFSSLDKDDIEELLTHISKIKDGAINVKDMELAIEKALNLVDISRKLGAETTIKTIQGTPDTAQAMKLIKLTDKILDGAIASLNLEINNASFVIKSLGADIQAEAVSIDQTNAISVSSIKSLLNSLTAAEKTKLKEGVFEKVMLEANEIEFAKSLGEMLKNGAIEKITGEIDVKLSEVLSGIHEKLSANNVIADSITLEKDHLSNLKDKIASTATVTVEKAKDNVAATAGNDTLKLDATVKDVTNLAITNFNAANDKIDFTALGMNAEKDVAENSAVAPETRITLENGKIYLFNATAADASALVGNFGDQATNEFSKAFSDGIAIILAKKDGSTWNVFKVEDKDSNDTVDEGDVTLLGTITPDAALTLDNIIVG